MKIFDKIENLKIYQKLLIVCLLTIGIAIFNFIYYNYQSLKLNADQRIYEVDINKLNIEGILKKDKQLVTITENSKITINFNTSYIRNLIINYKTTNDFNINYDLEKGNNYGLLKNVTESDKCYSFNNQCSININGKVGQMTLNLNQKDVTITSIKVDNQLYFNWITFLFWTITLNAICCTIMFKSFWFKKMHLFTAFLCLSFGFILLISTHNITSTTLDDDTHYYNVASIKYNDKYISKADYYLKNNILQFEYEDTKAEKKDAQTFLQSIENQDSSLEKENKNIFSTSKICYLPMGIALKVFSILGLNNTTSFFLARVIQLIIYTITISLAVKIMPNHKLLTMIIGIIPQSLFLATNYSYDPTVTAFLLLSFSAFANEYYHKNEKIKLKNILIFILAGLYGIFPKAIYCPFLLLLLLLPKEKFDNKKQQRIFNCLVIFIFLICIASYILPFIFEPSTLNGDTRGGNTSVIEQLKLILKQPVSFIKTFWREAILGTPANLFGPSVFGLLSYYGGMGIDASYFMILFALILAFISEKDFTTIKPSHRIIMLIIYSLIICSIWGSMYLAFTPVGEDVINGVQPRYFIPLLLPIIYCFNSKKLKNNLNEKNVMVCCTILYIISFVLLIYNNIIINYCL